MLLAQALPATTSLLETALEQHWRPEYTHSLLHLPAAALNNGRVWIQVRSSFVTERQSRHAPLNCHTAASSTLHVECAPCRLLQAHENQLLRPNLESARDRRELLRRLIDAPDAARSEWLTLRALEAEAESGRSGEEEGPPVLLHKLLRGKQAGDASAKTAKAGSQSKGGGGSKKGGGSGRQQAQGRQTAAAQGSEQGGSSCLLLPRLLERLLSRGCVDVRARATVSPDLAHCTLLHVCAAEARVELLKVRGGASRMRQLSPERGFRLTPVLPFAARPPRCCSPPRSR